jgi:hypothetical protein
MEIYIEKIAMIRPLLNQKNASLDLDVDWSVEYIEHDQDQINYNCILKSSDLKFKLEGILKLELFEEFNQEICSRIIFDKACELFMNTFSLTRQSSYNLVENKSFDYFGSEDIPNTLFN